MAGAAAAAEALRARVVSLRCAHSSNSDSEEEVIVCVDERRLASLELGAALGCVRACGRKADRPAAPRSRPRWRAGDGFALRKRSYRMPLFGSQPPAPTAAAAAAFLTAAAAAAARRRPADRLAALHELRACWAAGAYAAATKGARAALEDITLAAVRSQHGAGADCSAALAAAVRAAEAALPKQRRQRLAAEQRTATLAATRAGRRRGGGGGGGSEEDDDAGAGGTFGALPPEVVSTILRLLDGPIALGRSACVSRLWRRLAADERLWGRWAAMLRPNAAPAPAAPPPPATPADGTGFWAIPTPSGQEAAAAAAPPPPPAPGGSARQAFCAAARASPRLLLPFKTARVWRRGRGPAWREGRPGGERSVGAEGVAAWLLRGTPPG